MALVLFSPRFLAAALAGGLVTVAACTAPTLAPDDFPTRPSKPTKTDAGTADLKGADASVPVDEQDAAVPGPACETVPPSKRCGLAPQCGCGANETCEVTALATGKTSCVTGGTETLGRPCAETGDCMAGLTCMYGACRPYCKTPNAACSTPGTGLCVQELDEAKKPMPNLALCTVACDPRQPQIVCGANTCIWIPTFYAPAKVTDCNKAGAVAAFAACTKTSECKPGHACFDHPTYGLECEPWCRIGAAYTDCAAGTTCTDAFGADAPIVDGVKEGLCQ